MCSEAKNYSTLAGMPNQAADSLSPEVRAQVPTRTVVVAGLMVWAVFLLMMLY